LVSASRFRVVLHCCGGSITWTTPFMDAIYQDMFPFPLWHPQAMYSVLVCYNLGRLYTDFPLLWPVSV